jgi:hypothetical protein
LGNSVIGYLNIKVIGLPQSEIGYSTYFEDPMVIECRTQCPPTGSSMRTKGSPAGDSFASVMVKHRGMNGCPWIDFGYGAVRRKAHRSSLLQK